MNVLIFGATGMVGQGVLRECLLDPAVEAVQTVGRTPAGLKHPKLREIVHPDLFDYSAIEADLTGFDACFFCLGVSSGGMSEAAYERLTYGITIAAAETLARLSSRPDPSTKPPITKAAITKPATNKAATRKPAMTFVYVSGAGTDSSEKGRVMWARIKGKTENALMRLPFKGAYMFRPAAIQPMHGERSKTPAYRYLYILTKPLIPLFRRLFPNYVVTTEEIGRAMIRVAKSGWPTKIMESSDILKSGERKPQ